MGNLNFIVCHPLEQSRSGFYNLSIMNLQELPIGTEVTVRHRFLVAEVGYWSWEEEVITGTVYKHCNESTTLIQSGTSLVSCNNSKDEIIN